MSAREFDVDRISLPAGVSECYFDLWDYVERQYATSPECHRRHIFAVAYATYSKEKKEDIRTFLKKNPAANVDDVYISLSASSKFHHYCSAGKELLSELTLQFVDDSAVELLKKSADSLEKLENEVKTSSKMLADGLIKLENEVSTSSKVVRTIERWTVGRFFLHCAMRTTEAVFVVVILSILAANTQFWKPIVMKVYNHLGMTH